MPKEVNPYEEANKSFFADLFAQANLNPNEKFPTEHDLKDSAQRTDFRGQAVIVSLAYPTVDKIVKHCKRCNDVFSSNYPNVAYCSRHCIELYLKEHYGISWRPHGDLKKERWEILEEPQIVPMQAMVAMKEFILDVEKRLGHSIQVESGEWDNQLPPLTQEIAREKGLNLQSPAKDSEQPQIPVPVPNLSHTPELSAPLEQSQSDLEDWLFDE